MNLDNFDFDGCYKELKPLFMTIMNERTEPERMDFIRSLNNPIRNRLKSSGQLYLSAHRKVIKLMIEIYYKETGIRLQL